MIRLAGYFDVPLAQIDDMREALDLHVKLSRAEPGCLIFEVTPDPFVPGRFTVAEAFIDRAAFESHKSRTKASDWWKVSTGWPRHYSVEEVVE